MQYLIHIKALHCEPTLTESRLLLENHKPESNFEPLMSVGIFQDGEYLNLNLCSVAAGV